MTTNPSFEEQLAWSERRVARQSKLVEITRKHAEDCPGIVANATLRSAEDELESFQSQHDMLRARAG